MLELEAKIDSANRVLAAAASAVDEARGEGSGKAVVEAVLSSSDDHAWLAKVRVSATGELAPGDVWDELSVHPPDRRCGVLARALVELLEGVLARAAE